MKIHNLNQLSVFFFCYYIKSINIYVILRPKIIMNEVT